MPRDPDALADAARLAADPVRAPPAAEPVRAPAAGPVRAPPAAALAAPDAAADRLKPGAQRALGGPTGPPVVAPPSAPSAPTGSVVQFLNMKYCWPSVHRLVVTQ